ncbi:hypothetical protein [Sphingosinicella terrae]|uniref:hypothetical protein n=1 Tax=Sphingosinicella terrae TaxID=2172047 RepID=UPI000E0CCB17|nr:hypothetical protein [Sphingosinicella terrae]
MTVRVENPDLSLPPLVRILASGGDARIDLDAATGLNRYHSAPRPSEVLAFASSTANDVSAPAYVHVERLWSAIGPVVDGASYAEALEKLRGRIRSAYGLDETVAVVFAPSGTDLEYVALACIADRGAGGTQNILLGADEVGSGCIHSAHGRYFADRTALGVPTQAGEIVRGLDGVAVELVDIPVRDPDGRVRPSAEIAAGMETAIAAARGVGRHSLVHIVHGSKTGLILPSAEDVERLQAAHGDEASFVVDACQARITGAAVRAYLDGGAIVFVTGSKFMGAPPFSGFALVPERMAKAAPPLPAGLATIFRRGEWPAGWPGAEALETSANAGLLLRLEASLFELERFQALDGEETKRIILAFHEAVRREIVEKSAARRVAPYPPGHRDEADSHPIEMRTLSTLDLSRVNGGASFEEAQAWHKALIGHGVRLGQPVKCVRLPDGGWGATLRIGLAMWQIAERAGMDEAALARSFADDLARVREALAAVAG